MLRAFTVARPAVAAARSSLRASAASRSFATTTRCASDDHHGPTAPQLYGKGSNEPKIPSDADQATGIERLQLLGKMEGVDVFDMHPLDSSRLGTMQDPIKVLTYYPERLIGCTGSPADSHEVVWLSANISKDRHRCPECGSVYALDLQGEQHAHH